MSKQYRYIRLENINKYENWDLVEVIPAKFEHHYDMAVICNEETPKNDELHAEIRMLKNAYEQIKWERDMFEEDLQTAKAEIERLKKPTSASAIQILAEQAVNSVERTPQFISEIKADAIKEFVEQVTNMCDRVSATPFNKTTAPSSWSSAYEMFAADIEVMYRETVGTNIGVVHVKAEGERDDAKRSEEDDT